MIIKLDKNSVTNDVTIDKINEIIDFLNGTFLMKVQDDPISGTINDCIGDQITILNDELEIFHPADSVKCPHCGASHYMEGSSMSTCVYYPPIWKDGVNVNPDRNTTRTHCKCLECGKEFYKEY